MIAATIVSAIPTQGFVKYLLTAGSIASIKLKVRQAARKA
jgi:hypothetical protein